MTYCREVVRPWHLESCIKLAEAGHHIPAGSTAVLCDRHGSSTQHWLPRLGKRDGLQDKQQGTPLWGLQALQAEPEQQHWQGPVNHPG